jgi:hypothetical protein
MVNARTVAAVVVSLIAVSAAWANKVSEDQQKWVPQYKKQANAPKPAEMLVNSDPEPDLGADFVALYNGKDLTGWTPRGGRCRFEAKGDAIVGTCVKGSPSTYLSTVKSDYADFVFSCEIKWEVDGNSGVMFRAQKKESKGKETVFGPQAEMEGFAKKRYWSGGIYGQSCGGWYYPLWLDAHKDARGALKQNDWNRLTIKAQGDVVKTWLNGKPAAHWKTDTFLKGFFALQIHSGKAGTVHFRGIKIKEL